MWGNVAVTQAYLTLSEVLGHVDLLVADGAGRGARRTTGVTVSAPVAGRLRGRDGAGPRLPPDHRNPGE